MAANAPIRERSNRSHPSIKALLVYPEFPDTFWSFRHAIKFERKRSAFPPLGLMTVSAMLPPAWQRRLVDMNVEPLRDEDLRWADVVFASAMLVQKASLAEVARRAKAFGKRLVVGGPYVTTNTRAVPEADHLVLGEAETLVGDLARGIEDGDCPRVLQAAERPDLTRVPLPDFGLVRLSAYSAMAVQYSRGCPFNCEFCDIIEIYGRVPRTKTNDQMLAELDALLATGWRGLVFVVDDNFIGNKKNVRTLLPELAEWNERNGRPFSFVTEASVNLADDARLLEAMRRANFRRVFLGIETPVEETLVEAQKKQNTRGNLLDAVSRIQSYGMEVMAGFIVGFDSDPDDIFERQIRFIRETAIPVAMVGLLTALPDTQLWRRLGLEGRLVQESTGDNTDCSLNFVPRMDAARLVAGYKQILRTVFSPAEFYNRALETLRRVGWTPEPRRGSLAENVATLARLVVELGVRDRERREFWRYFLTAATRHRERFAQAMQLAATGYHLRKLTERWCD
jgi:radical SAM superfamily enzyme YgiQ (UPF0313 family)